MLKRVGVGCKGLTTMAEYAVHACRTGSPSMEMYSPLRKDNQKGVPKTQTTYRNIHSAGKKDPIRWVLTPGMLFALWGGG